MTEQQMINGKKVWIKVEPYHVERSNPNILPTEYFTASYFLQEPLPEARNGLPVNDDNGKIKLFESPVAALSYTEKKPGKDFSILVCNYRLRFVIKQACYQIINKT